MYLVGDYDESGLYELATASYRNIARELAPENDIQRFHDLARPTEDGQQSDLSLERLYPMSPGHTPG